MSAPTFGLEAALEEFGEVFGDGYCLADIATALTCREADALASLLRELGKPEAAEALISAHAEVDDEGDDHFRPVCSACGTALVNEDCPNYGNGEEHA